MNSPITLQVHPSGKYELYQLLAGFRPIFQSAMRGVFFIGDPQKNVVKGQEFLGMGCTNIF